MVVSGWWLGRKGKLWTLEVTRKRRNMLPALQRALKEAEMRPHLIGRGTKKPAGDVS